MTGTSENKILVAFYTNLREPSKVSANLVRHVISDLPRRLFPGSLTSQAGSHNAGTLTVRGVCGVGFSLQLYPRTMSMEWVSKPFYST